MGCGAASAKGYWEPPNSVDGGSSSSGRKRCTWSCLRVFRNSERQRPSGGFSVVTPADVATTDEGAGSAILGESVVRAARTSPTPTTVQRQRATGDLDCGNAFVVETSPSHSGEATSPASHHYTSSECNPFGAKDPMAPRQGSTASTALQFWPGKPAPAKSPFILSPKESGLMALDSTHGEPSRLSKRAIQKFADPLFLTPLASRPIGQSSGPPGASRTLSATTSERWLGASASLAKSLDGPPVKASSESKKLASKPAPVEMPGAPEDEKSPSIMLTIGKPSNVRAIPQPANPPCQENIDFRASPLDIILEEDSATDVHCEAQSTTARTCLEQAMGLAMVSSASSPPRDEQVTLGQADPKPVKVVQLAAPATPIAAGPAVFEARRAAVVAADKHAVKPVFDGGSGALAAALTLKSDDLPTYKSGSSEISDAMPAMPARSVTCPILDTSFLDEARTSITAPVAAGSIKLVVTSTIGFTIGDMITIADAQKSETNRIEDFDPGAFIIRSIILDSPLKNSYARGATVVKATGQLGGSRVKRSKASSIGVCQLASSLDGIGGLHIEQRELGPRDTFQPLPKDNEANPGWSKISGSPGLGPAADPRVRAGLTSRKLTPQPAQQKHLSRANQVLDPDHLVGQRRVKRTDSGSYSDPGLAFLSTRSKSLDALQGELVFERASSQHEAPHLRSPGITQLSRLPEDPATEFPIPEFPELEEEAEVEAKEEADREPEDEEQLEDDFRVEKEEEEDEPEPWPESDNKAVESGGAILASQCCRDRSEANESWDSSTAIPKERQPDRTKPRSKAAAAESRFSGQSKSGQASYNLEAQSTGSPVLDSIGPLDLELHPRELQPRDSQQQVQPSPRGRQYENNASERAATPPPSPLQPRQPGNRTADSLAGDLSLSSLPRLQEVGGEQDAQREGNDADVLRVLGFHPSCFQ